MYWHCEDNNHIGASYLSESLCDEMFRYCEDLHHRHRDLQIIHLILGDAFYHLRGRHC